MRFNSREQRTEEPRRIASVELIVSTKEEQSEPEKKWNFRVSNIMLNINARNLFLVFKEYTFMPYHLLMRCVAWPFSSLIYKFQQAIIINAKLILYDIFDI